MDLYREVMAETGRYRRPWSRWPAKKSATVRLEISSLEKREYGRPKTRKTKWLKTYKKQGRFFVVSINILAILLVLVLVEVTARFVMDPMPNPETRRGEALQYAPSIFSRHVFPQREIAAEGLHGREYYINELGYRGMPFTREKPAGVIRIMFYGGSQVFDSPADVGHDWPFRWKVF